MINVLFLSIIINFNSVESRIISQKYYESLYELDFIVQLKSDIDNIYIDHPDKEENDSLFEEALKNLLIDNNIQTPDSACDSIRYIVDYLTLDWQIDRGTLFSSDEFRWIIKTNVQLELPSGRKYWITIDDRGQISQSEAQMLGIVGQEKRNLFEIFGIGLFCAGIIYSFYIIK